MLQLAFITGAHLTHRAAMVCHRLGIEMRQRRPSNIGVGCAESIAQLDLSPPTRFRAFPKECGRRQANVPQHAIVQIGKGTPLMEERIPRRDPADGQHAKTLRLAGCCSHGGDCGFAT